MSDLFLELFNRATAAGWVVLAVLLLRLVLKKAPRWVHCGLWGLVGLRLVWPFSLESVLSLLPSREVLPPEVLFDPTPAVHTGIGFVNTAVNGSFTPAMTAQAGASVNPLQVWTWLAGWVWAMGAAALVGYALFSFLRLRKRVAVSVEEQGLWRCDDIDSPFILGLFRPRIYVPSDLGDGDLVYVAAHERAHLKRRDHWWKPLGYLLLTVFWFHPLLWVGYVLLCRDIEMACDETVVRDLDEAGKRAYSLALVDCAVDRRAIAACPVAFGEVGVRQRVKSVLHYKKPAFWVVVIAVVLCVAAAVCFLTDPVGTAGELPLGTTYYFQERIYENGSYSSSYDLFLAESYRVSETGDFVVDGENLGPWQPIRLTRKNFDACIRMPLVWQEGYSAPILRRNNADAWILTGGEDLYFLLRQKDGTIYLAQGRDTPEYDPSIRFIFRLGGTPTTIAGPEGQEMVVTVEPADPLADGSAYISTECVYMNLLSSQLGTADSGYYYYIANGEFAIVYRKSNAEKRVKLPAEWKELPYTEEEWEALFSLAIGVPSIADYTQRLWRPLDETYTLLSMDGELWLLEQRGYPWSIHRLERVENTETARWSYMEGVDAAHRPVVLDFGLDFDRLHLDCDVGQIFGATTNVNYEEKLYYSGQSELIYWTPLNEDGTTAPDRAEITFSVWKDDAVTAEGVLTIDRQGNCGIQVKGSPVGTVRVKDSDFSLLFTAELPAAGPSLRNDG